MLFVCRIVLAFALFCATDAQSIGAHQVKHNILDEANLIETSAGYAITAPALSQNNWKAVNVYGNQVQVIAADCQQTILSKQELDNTPVQQALLLNAKQLLESVETNNSQLREQTHNRSGSVRYSFGGNMATMSFARNIEMSSFQSDGYSMTKYDDQNMSISKTSGLPDNMNRIFITGDVVSYVYTDGRVQMKPVACLQENEKQFIQQLKAEVQQHHDRFQTNMNQFNQNMQNMNKRMHQNMQQMHQNLNGMFDRNNFLFNQAMNNHQFQPLFNGANQYQPQHTFNGANHFNQHHLLNGVSQFHQQPFFNGGLNHLNSQQQQFQSKFPQSNSITANFMGSLPGLATGSTTFSLPGGLPFGQASQSSNGFWPAFK